jgi:hypothetical protein
VAGPSKRWLFWIAIFVVIGYIGARQFNAEDYPADWPAPAIFPGWRGGCPGLAGEYDGVDHRIPRVLRHQPIWEKGIRPWFEHKAKVEQSSDGGTLRITFALNERGLPRHRDHVLKHGSMWPSGHGLVLELNRKDHYDCRIRWLTLDAVPDLDGGDEGKAGKAGKEVKEVKEGKDGIEVKEGNGRVRLSVDGEGNFVLGYTKKEWTSFGTFFGQSVGPSWQTDRTRWVRWTKRPREADAALKEVQSLSVTRLKRHAVHGPRQLISIGNFLGEDACVRLWDQKAANPDDPAAGIRNAAGRIGTRKRMADGSIGLDLPCPAGWEWLKPTETENYFLMVDDGMPHDYRLAWRLLARPDAQPVVRELGEIAELPAPPQR